MEFLQNIKTKDIITILLVITGIVVVIFVGKKLLDFFNKSEVKDYDKETNKKNLTYNESEYKTFADVIFQAAHGFGTDENAIYRVLGYLKTNDDWLHLVSIYGTDTDGFTLPARLIYELDETEQGKVNAIISKYNAKI